MLYPDHKLQATALVVDDEPGALEAAAVPLRRLVSRVETVRSGREAVELVRAGLKPDLVLLDVLLPPGMDGYETLRVLREQGLGDVPVIMFSGLEDVEYRVRGMAFSAIDYIVKPFSPRELVARANAHLRVEMLKRDLRRKNEQLQDARRRIELDLDAAAGVQRAWLPHRLPDLPGYDCGWACTPCEALGGDALDVFSLNGGTIGFFLLDVSGHGIAASLLAMSITKTLAPRADRLSLVVNVTDDGRRVAVSPAEVLNRLNALNPMSPDRNPHFATIVYGTLEVPTGVVRWANAGHPRPVIARADGTVERQDGGSLPIGVDPETRYEEWTARLAPGDRLYVYSDGLYEQRSHKGRHLGMPWLMEQLGHRTDSVGDRISAIMQDVRSWAAPASPADDLSVLGFARLPAANKAAA